MKSSLVQRIRVPLGFAYAVLFLFFSHPVPFLFYPGMGVALGGLALRVWASGYLNKGRQLAVAGPYRITRNPLYLGSFFMGLGFTVAGGNIWLMALFPLLFFALYLPVMEKEEKELTRIFGEPYEIYRDQVALFLPLRPFQPSVGGQSMPPSGNFQWERIIYNREYKAMIGFVLVSALIWSKMLWL
jgi:protein-S-isoprenylcysteine O-methyltransferase Ste14